MIAQGALKRVPEAVSKRTVASQTERCSKGSLGFKRMLIISPLPLVNDPRQGLVRLRTRDVLAHRSRRPSGGLTTAELPRSEISR